MGKVTNYIFLLIALLIVVVYYKGTSDVVVNTGASVRRVINTLQGRNDQGEFANYPK